MPVGRLLEAVRDVEDPRLVEVVALELQADRQAVGRRSRTGIDIAGGPVRLAAMVKMSFRYICTGSSVFAPSLNAARGRGRPRDDVAALEARAKSSRDQPAHLLRLQVVGVVVAVREHVGADQDAPLHFGAEAFGARLQYMS